MSGNPLDNEFEQAKVGVAILIHGSGKGPGRMFDAEMNHLLKGIWPPVGVQVSQQTWIILEIE